VICGPTRYQLDHGGAGDVIYLNRELLIKLIGFAGGIMKGKVTLYNNRLKIKETNKV